MYKILVGIPAASRELIIDKEFEDDVDPWCDFEVVYYEGRYHMEFETLLGFETPDGCRNWILECYNVFTDYMNSHGLDRTRELDMWSVFTNGVDVNTQFKELEDLYAFMKLLVLGFHGDGIRIK